jgi:hypothetical protein
MLEHNRKIIAGMEEHPVRYPVHTECEQCKATKIMCLSWTFPGVSSRLLFHVADGHLLIVGAAPLCNHRASRVTLYKIPLGLDS